MLEVSQAVSSTLDLEEILQVIANGTARLLAVESAAIYLLEGAHLYLGATTPPLEGSLPEPLRWAKPVDHPTLERALTTLEPVTLLDARRASLAPAERAAVELRQLRSLLYLPFDREGKAIGVLILGTVSQEHRFTDREIALCRTLTHQLALAVQNARLHSGLREHAASLEAAMVHRLEAERALRGSEERFRALFQQAGDYLLLLEPRAGQELFIADANEAACETLGYAIEELREASLGLLDPSAEAPQTKAHIRACLRGQGVHWETEHRRKDGSLFPVEVSAKYVVPERGAPFIIASERDVTARKRAESEQSRHARAISLFNDIARVFLTSAPQTVHSDALQVLLDGFESPAGCLGHLDVDGLMRRTSSRAESATLRQQGVADKAVQQDAWSEIWQQALASGRARIEQQPPALDGVSYEAALLAPVVHRGQLIGQLCVVGKWPGYDEDDRGLLESIATQISPVLQALLREARQGREQAKIAEALREARKMEAVGQLAGGVAHDFNNLLQVIQGYCELAQDEVEPRTSLAESLEFVARATERASLLVRQLLAFSRRQVLRLRVTDLNEIIRDLVPMLKPLVGEHVSLDFDPSGVASWVSADPNQLEQVLINLCVNARDAMPRGGTLSITTRHVTLDEESCERRMLGTPGPHIRLTVADTGCGMSADARAKAFEPFFTTKEPGAGTGLGLASVYGLVQQHRGSVDISSELGRGTTFEIHLPLALAPLEEPPSSGARASQQGQELILIAEDHDMVRGLAQSFLESAGYTVLVAEDGERALELFDEHSSTIAAAVLDVVMPKLGGDSVYQRIEALRPGLPVLFASGYSERALHANLVPDGKLQLIQKPYGRAELLRRVRQLLDTPANE